LISKVGVVENCTTDRRCEAHLMTKVVALLRLILR
jgi:hypothetical protein